MQTNILKIISIMIMMILGIDSPVYSELDHLIIPALQCIYCIPSYYPHGLPWYAIMETIFLFAKTQKTILMAMAIINFFVMFALRNKVVFWPYFFASVITHFVIPQNYPVIWMIALSGFRMPKRLQMIFLPISVATKIPVGAPLPVWQFIFSASLNVITNYQWDYGVLTVLWMLFLGYQFPSVRNGARITWMRMKHKKY